LYRVVFFAEIEDEQQHWNKDVGEAHPPHRSKHSNREKERQRENLI
jgi:hypothetical protein